jgi:hypothetical protein
MTGWGTQGLLVAAIAASLAGCSASSSTTSGAESSASVDSQETKAAELAKPTGAPSENRTDPAEAASSKGCTRQTRAGSRTSCPFAERVQAAFVADEKADGFPPAEVAVYSPLSNHEYHLQCVLIAQRTTAECTTGAALAYFPLPGREILKPEHREQAPQSNEGSGKVVECSDETYSHAGGKPGACPDDGVSEEE